MNLNFAVRTMAAHGHVTCNDVSTHRNQTVFSCVVAGLESTNLTEDNLIISWVSYHQIAVGMYPTIHPEGRNVGYHQVIVIPNSIVIQRNPGLVFLHF